MCFECYICKNYVSALSFSSEVVGAEYSGVSSLDADSHTTSYKWW